MALETSLMKAMVPSRSKRWFRVDLIHVHRGKIYLCSVRKLVSIGDGHGGIGTISCSNRTHVVCVVAVRRDMWYGGGARSWHMGMWHMGMWHCVCARKMAVSAIHDDRWGAVSRTRLGIRPQFSDHAE